MPIPAADYAYRVEALEPSPYQNIALTKPWPEYTIGHELTDTGIEKFAADWNGLIKS